MDDETTKLEARISNLELAVMSLVGFIEAMQPPEDRDALLNMAENLFESLAALGGYRIEGDVAFKGGESLGEAKH